MPPRWMSLAIVAFWLTTCNWMFWRDLWPSLEPGQPPPYYIDLEEEAQQDQLQVRWRVLHNGREDFVARTWVDYQEESDTFALAVEFKPKAKPGDSTARLTQLLQRLTSRGVVGRRGELRELDVGVWVEPGIEAFLGGQIRNGRFVPQGHLKTPLGTREFSLPPVEVSYHGSVLVPLHPVNRILRLRPGQRWRMPLVDPLAASFGGDAVTFLDAQVLPAIRPLTLENRSYDCRVIEYHGEDRAGSTWVEVKSGLVLRQEARHGDDHWDMLRDTNLPADN